MLSALTFLIAFVPFRPQQPLRPPPQLPALRSARLPPRITLQQYELDPELFIGDAGRAAPAATRKKRRPAPAPKRVKVGKEAKLRIGCYGCGASLQMDEPAAAGYVEPERYDLKAQHRQLRLLLCSRCRSLTQGKILPAVVEGRLRSAPSASVSGAGVTTPEQLRAELAPLRDQKALVALLVDMCDVTGSFLPRVRDLIGGNPIVLIGTKADLLPRGTEAAEVLAWLTERIAPRLNIIDAHLVSARTGDGVAAASRAILRERSGRDVFILGAANVGKSLFVGRFIEHAMGARAKRLPISSATPGTTLKLIGIDCFGGGSMLFDTPGLHLAHRLSASLLPEELQAILPRGRIRPYTPPTPLVGGKTSFLWGGLARLDVVRAPLAARLTFITPYALRVTPCEEGADAAAALQAREAGRGLTPPLTPESAAQLGGLELRRTVELTLTAMTQAADISISGLGWVAVGAVASLRAAAAARGVKADADEAMRLVVDVWVPKGVEVSVRPPMPVGGLPAAVHNADKQ